MKNNLKPMQAWRGFTLTELVIVIVILGIISTVVTPLISNKFSAVSQSVVRASWVQSAEFALFHIRQDIAQSVPNSLQSSEPSSGADQVFELLTTSINSGVYAARYRNRQYNPYDRLQVNNDDSFDLFGSYSNVPGFVSVGANNATALWADWENLRAGNSNGAVANVVSSSTAAAENGSPITNVVLSNSGNHRFGNHSPYYRAYFTDGPVGYFCDIANNQLIRVRGYNNLSAASFATRTAAGTADRIIDNLISCEFSLSAGSVYLAPTLRVALEIGAGGESIQLIDTIQLSNGS